MEKNRLLYHYLHFEVRKVFTTSMIPNVFWTPFETLDLILTLNAKTGDNFNFLKYYQNLKDSKKLNDIYFYTEKGKTAPIETIKIAFNCMDCFNETDKINFPSKAKFGNYRIASSMLKT